MIQILNFFKKYELTTGATTNISKTKIGPLANGRLYNLDKKNKNIQITNPNDFIKILGIYFTNDLQKTSTFNWEQCTTIFEKQLQQCLEDVSPLEGK